MIWLGLNLNDEKPRAIVDVFAIIACLLTGIFYSANNIFDKKLYFLNDIILIMKWENIIPFQLYQKLSHKINLSWNILSVMLKIHKFNMKQLKNIYANLAYIKLYFSYVFFIDHISVPKFLSNKFIIKFPNNIKTKNIKRVVE